MEGIPLEPSVLDQLRESRMFGNDPNGNWITLSVDANGQIQASLAAETIAIEGDDDDGNTLNVNAETLSEAITDPNGLVTYSAGALASQAQDQVRVDLQTNNAGTLPVEQQTPVGVEDAGGTQIDPLARQDASPVTGSTAVAGTDVTLVLGDYRKDVDWFVDVSGAATLTVEARTAGGTWRPFDTVDYSAAATEVEQYSTAFAEMRASVGANLNTLEGSAKGV